MAKNNALRGARKRLTWLMILILGLAALIEGYHLAGRNASFTPQLALDLQGGTSIILQPNLVNGSKLQDGTLEQAVAIIRQRVDATGVSEAQMLKVKLKV